MSSTPEGQGIACRPERMIPGSGLRGTGPGEIDGDEEVTDEPPFVKEAPIDLAGPWRTVLHCNFWWVAGHRFLHPCRDERAAEKLCRTLREEWEENSLSAASRASG